LNEAIPFNPYLCVFLIFFPLANGYVIVRFRLLRTDYWVRQGLVYTLLTVLVVAAYGLLVTGIAFIFSINMPYDNPYLIGALVFLIAVLLDPVRTRLQALVDSTFFRGQRAYQERLRGFSHDLTNALDLNTIGRVLREQIASSLVPDRMHIYTYDSLNDQYVALANGDGRPTVTFGFPPTVPLFNTSKKKKSLCTSIRSIPPRLCAGMKLGFLCWGRVCSSRCRARSGPWDGSR
jgi:hypothetical protein